MEIYRKNISEIYKEFSTSPSGLSAEEAASRLKKIGKNQLKKIRKTPLILKFFLQFKDLLVIILLVAALLALTMQEPRDALIILVIVIINAIIGFIQEYKAEKVLSALKEHLPSYSKATRNNKLEEVLTEDLVPGDILVLEPGDAVGADARIIESFDLKTNDFSLTGESSLQAKKAYNIAESKSLTDIDNMVFMGTLVAEGKAKTIVVATSMNTEFGKIARETQVVKEAPTPLQREMIHTGKTVAKIASAVAVIALGLFYFILHRELKECLLFAIAAGAAVVPEGLPAAMSIALSLGAQRMLKKKALVKKLLHVESLGSVTTICTDKTGTLTTGEMSLIRTLPDISEIKSKNLGDIFLRTLLLCNDASIDPKPVGNPLEIALLKYVLKVKPEIVSEKETKKIFDIPFSSDRKMMTVVYGGNEQIAYSKGATEEILECCSLGASEKKRVLDKNNQMAKNGLKVIALAYKKIGKRNDFIKENLEKSLEFISLVGLSDPPRQEVYEAISICKKAKIRVIMLTRDYDLTALHIAQEIGLIGKDGRAISSGDLHGMDDDRLKEILKTETVFSRIEPMQKLRIVKCLQEMGEVVAVTGDGVNDAPALVKADIGVAMGKIGTQVAKEAADMIILDDNFATIVVAVREGRRIFDNAKKFVYYVFSSNSGELFAPFFGIMIGLPLPLIAIQILAIDLGTDVFPSLALGIEKEEEGIMERAPRSQFEKIMSLPMLWRLLDVGVVMGILALVIYIITLYQGGWHWGEFLAENNKLYWSATATVYTTLVFCQIANAFSCRSGRESVFKIGFFSNHWLLGAEIISAVLLWLVIGFPPLQNVFRTAWPSALAWILIFASFFIFLAFIEIWKKIITPKKDSKKLSS